MMKRREFIKKTGKVAAVAAAVGVGCGRTGSGSKTPTARTYEWKMATTWPSDLPVMQTGAERFARRVEETTGGRIRIQVFAADELLDPLGVFDAVSEGSVECGGGAAYYWGSKAPAAQWFTTVPFGMNAQGINAWFYSGGGLELWEEVYAPFNLVPRPLGNTGVQMGGWFQTKINTIEDFSGLRMRIPGLGGKVIAAAGGKVVLLAGGEIFPSLEKGEIDATERVGPMHDLRMGFYKVAKYYYYPGWHEPGTCLEVIFNKNIYDSLPRDLQLALDAVAAETNIWSLSEFEAGNGAALQELITRHHVNLVRFPEPLLEKLRILARETLEDEADKDTTARRVHEAYKRFKERVGIWGSVSENAFYNVIADRFKLKI